MFTDLLILVPVGLALGLVAFGRYGNRDPEPTPARIALTAIAAVLLGPVAVDALGLFVWLLGVAAVVAAITMIAMLRPPAPPHHRI
jgi:hypothetical protein